jgi:hypothetical protein
MPDYSTRSIIDFADGGNASEFRNALYASIHDKVSAHIDAKKQEIAQNLITPKEQPEEPVEQTTGELETEV